MPDLSKITLGTRLKIVVNDQEIDATYLHPIDLPGFHKVIVNKVIHYQQIKEVLQDEPASPPVPDNKGT